MYIPSISKLCSKVKNFISALQDWRHFRKNASLQHKMYTNKRSYRHSLGLLGLIRSLKNHVFGSAMIILSRSKKTWFLLLILTFKTQRNAFDATLVYLCGTLSIFQIFHYFRPFCFIVYCYICYVIIGMFSYKNFSFFVNCVSKLI